MSLNVLQVKSYLHVQTQHLKERIVPNLFSNLFAFYCTEVKFLKYKELHLPTLFCTVLKKRQICGSLSIISKYPWLLLNRKVDSYFPI